MIKEEIIKHLRFYKQGAEDAKNPIDGDADYYQGKIDAINDVISMLSSFSEPPLPSDLDEAARLYAIPSYMKDVDKEHLDEYSYNKADEIAFKAGAEWMAKQGVSMEVVRGVPWRAVDAFIHDHDYTEDSIIQIRKK